MLINDTKIYEEQIIAIPSIFSFFEDSIFKTNILRVSDAQNSLDNSYGDGRNLIHISPEYSTINPFSVDDNYFLLQHSSFFALYERQNLIFKDLFKYQVAASSEPRWINNEQFIYIVNNQLRLFDVQKFNFINLKTFSSFNKISMAGEQDISWDKEHIALIGDSKEIFVYNFLHNIQYKSLIASNFDNVYITPHNNVIIGYYNQGNQRFNGIELYDINMNFLRQLTYAMGHMDVMLDSINSEVMIWAAGAEIRNGINKNTITKIKLVDGTRENLIEFNWQLGKHISTSQDEWIIVSTYTPDMTKPSCIYKDEIIRININTKEIQRLCQHHSKSYNNYIYAPKATCNNNGNLILFHSNMGQNPYINYGDSYLIDLSQKEINEITYDLNNYNVTISNGKLTLKGI
jgi:hypothetical protein